MHSDPTEEEIMSIEKELGINQFRDTHLEIYSIGDSKMLLKASSPYAEYDNVAAVKMRKWFDEKGINHEGDSESRRDVIISLEDYISLFVFKEA